MMVKMVNLNIKKREREIAIKIYIWKKVDKLHFFSLSLTQHHTQNVHTHHRLAQYNTPGRLSLFVS